MTVSPAQPAATPEAAKPILAVKNIEVIYDHVILVLKGVSLEVPAGRHRRAAGRQRRRQVDDAEGDLQPACESERGEVTKGSIEFKGERVDGLTPNDLVRRGCIQVMEGRHCFGHLTVEENLLTGAFTRKRRPGAIAADLEMVTAIFRASRSAAPSLAGYISGGEQQMTAIGRALMSAPDDDAAGRAFDGAGAAAGRGDLRDRASDMNAEQGVSRAAGRAEHQHGAASMPATATSSRTAAW